MRPEALDLQLRQHTRKIYTVLIAIIIVSMIVGIAFTAAYLQSKDVKIYEYPIGDSVFTREETVYNEDLKFGIAGALIIYLLTTIVLITVSICHKHKTFELNGNYITIYTAMTGTRLYINGECCSDAVSKGYFLEGKTPDGICITVSISRRNRMHVTFSNGHAPMDF